MADKFDLDAGLFMHVRHACSAQAVRVYLEAVLVEPHPERGCLMVATDGRVMLVAHDTSASAPRAALVRLQMCEDATDDPERDEWDDHLPTPTFDGSRLEFTLDGDAPALATVSQSWCPGWRRGVIEEVCEARKYPDWRRVFSGRGGGVKAPQPPYNSSALDAEIIARVSAGRAVRIMQPEAPGGPSRLYFDDRPSLSGLIMPRHATIRAPDFELEIIKSASASQDEGAP